MSESKRQLVAILAVAGPVFAVLPVAGGLDGGWIALHLIGGVLSLMVLLWAAWQLQPRNRWPAYAVVLVSLVVIGVVTRGGTIGDTVEIFLAVPLGAVYFGCVARAVRSPGPQPAGAVDEDGPAGGGR